MREPAMGSAGTADLHVARHGGRSVVTRAFAVSPVRLLTPRNHGTAAWVYTSSYGGGLVDGDATALGVAVSRGASAYVSTQAATKVYRSPSGTTSLVRAEVEGGALLALAPDPVVCFAGANYRQSQRIELAGDAGLVLVDWMVGGRFASGERWAFTSYESVIEVRVEGRLCVYDPVSLQARDGALAERFGRFAVLATVIVAGGALREDAAALLALASAARVGRKADVVITASPVAAAGCIVRAAAVAVEPLARSLRALLAFVPPRLGDDPWRRKW